MSHSVNIQTQFKNITTLLSEFTSLGWTVKENTKCRTYPSDPRRDEFHRYVAVNPQNGYDIGINLDEKGHAYFVCDFFDSSIQRQLGQNLSKVKQGYSVRELKKFLREEDLVYKIDTLASGELVVTAGE